MGQAPATRGKDAARLRRHSTAIDRTINLGKETDVMQSTYHRSADLLLRAASAMQAAAQSLRRCAERLDRWLEDRRATRRAVRDFSAMSDRELKDIGLARSDTWRVAHENPWRPPDTMLAEVSPETTSDARGTTTGGRPYKVVRRRALHAPLFPPACS
jgi:uncharacterized protein YjiS (DUF1127 family)